MRIDLTARQCLNGEHVSLKMPSRYWTARNQFNLSSVRVKALLVTPETPSAYVKYIFKGTNMWVQVWANLECMKSDATEKREQCAHART